MKSWNIKGSIMCFVKLKFSTVDEKRNVGKDLEKNKKQYFLLYPSETDY